MNNGSMVENSNSYNSSNNNNMDMNKMIDMSPTMKDSDTKMNTNKPIVNMANYQSAKGMAEKLLDIFNKELKPIISQNRTSTYGTNLGKWYHAACKFDRFQSLTNGYNDDRSHTDSS